MTREIKRPQLTDIEKLPSFFQDLYEKWNRDNKNGLTPETVRNFIAEIKLAYEMASYSLTQKISLGNIFNALDNRSDLFPSAKFVSSWGRATAYFKAENCIKSVTPKTVRPVRKTPTNIILIRSKNTGIIRQ